MLIIKLTEDVGFDEDTNTFVEKELSTLEFEHSLVSLSKWEQKFEKPFLGEGEKSNDEVMYYIECMLLTEDVSPEVLEDLEPKHLDQINDYINKKATATWFSDNGPRSPSREVVTSELIYYMMIAFKIPFECQFWHLSRLFTLIEVCSRKNDTRTKKLSPQELADRNRRLNAERREKYNTTG